MNEFELYFSQIHNQQPLNIDFNQFQTILKEYVEKVMSNFLGDKAQCQCHIRQLKKGHEGLETYIQDPDTLYAITVNKDGFYDTIMFKGCFKRFHQQLYHFAYDDKESLEFFYEKGIQTVFDIKKGEITESIDYSEEQTRKATKFDILKMEAIANSFQDKKLLFKKELKNTK